MSENITINLTQPQEEITFSYTEQGEEITFSFSEAARGPQGEPGSSVNVTNANVNAAIEDDPSATRLALELGNAATMTVDADLPTFSLPSNTTISAFGASLVDDATAGDARTTIGAAATVHTHVVGDIVSISGQHLLGRHAGGSGAGQEVTVSNGIEFQGSGIRRSALTGDVTASAGSNTTTIANGAVTEAKCNAAINTALTNERVPTEAGLTSKFGTNKATIVDGDKVTILDSAASDAPKHVLWSLIVSTLTTAFNSLYVGLTGNQTVAGDKTLSGQLELTGQAATNSTSAMSRALAGKEPFFNIGVVRNVIYPPAFANSGTTGAAAITVAGDRLFSITSGSVNSGWGRASIARGINQVPSLSGSGIRFNKKIGVSITVSLGTLSFNDLGNIFRLIVGSNQTPAADGVNPITYRGFGVEFKSRGSSHDWRLFAHNGTAISYSAWTNTGMAAAQPIGFLSTFAVESDGAGNITGYFGADCTRTLSTLTLTGGPTTAGTSAQSYVDVHVANSTTGTASLSVAGFDAKIYSE